MNGLEGKILKLPPKKQSFEKFEAIFTVCFYFDRQMTVRIIEPQFKKEREFQKFIKKIFTQPNCHCKHRKI